MELSITVYDIHIEVGQIKARHPYADREVFVARVGKLLHFSQIEEATFTEEVAAAIAADDDGGGRFEVSIAPAMLRRALRTTSGGGGAYLDGAGRITSDAADPSVVRYYAVCGELYLFDRADLEEVLAEFGGR